MRTAKRYLTYTRYSVEDVVSIREDLWTGELPDDYADYIWQWAESGREARQNHHRRMDEMNALINAGLGERDTY